MAKQSEEITVNGKLLKSLLMHQGFSQDQRVQGVVFDFFKHFSFRMHGALLCTHEDQCGCRMEVKGITPQTQGFNCMSCADTWLAKCDYLVKVVNVFFLERTGKESQIVSVGMAVDSTKVPQNYRCDQFGCLESFQFFSDCQRHLKLVHGRDILTQDSESFVVKGSRSSQRRARKTESDVQLKTITIEKTFGKLIFFVQFVELHLGQKNSMRSMLSVQGTLLYKRSKCPVLWYLGSPSLKRLLIDAIIWIVLRVEEVLGHRQLLRIMWIKSIRSLIK